MQKLLIALMVVFYQAPVALADYDEQQGTDTQVQGQSQLQVQEPQQLQVQEQSNAKLKIKSNAKLKIKSNARLQVKTLPSKNVRKNLEFATGHKIDWQAAQKNRLQRAKKMTQNVTLTEDDKLALDMLKQTIAKKEANHE